MTALWSPDVIIGRMDLFDRLMTDRWLMTHHIISSTDWFRYTVQGTYGVKKSTDMNVCNELSPMFSISTHGAKMKSFGTILILIGIWENKIQLSILDYHSKKKSLFMQLVNHSILEMHEMSRSKLVYRLSVQSDCLLIML